jgi:hypothetical protein
MYKVGVDVIFNSCSTSIAHPLATRRYSVHGESYTRDIESCLIRFARTPLKDAISEQVPYVESVFGDGFVPHSLSHTYRKRNFLLR